MKTPGETKHRPEVSPVIQRILGAAVLVAIALVAIPALFDFSRRQSPGIEEGIVPPRPDHLRVEVLPLPASKPPVVPRQQIDAELKARVPVPATSTTTTQRGRSPGPAGEGDAKAATRRGRAPVAARSGTKPKATSSRRSGPVTRVNSRSTPTSGWVVQIGSFGRKDNARRLLRRVEKARFTGLLERSTRSGRPLIRVLVGPVATRQEARELERRIKSRLAIDGLIVAYKPRAH